MPGATFWLLAGYTPPRPSNLTLKRTYGCADCQDSGCHRLRLSRLSTPRLVFWCSPRRLCRLKSRRLALKSLLLVLLLFPRFFLREESFNTRSSHLRDRHRDAIRRGRCRQNQNKRRRRQTRQPEPRQPAHQSRGRSGNQPQPLVNQATIQLSREVFSSAENSTLQQHALVPFPAPRIPKARVSENSRQIVLSPPCLSRFGWDAPAYGPTDYGHA